MVVLVLNGQGNSYMTVRLLVPKIKKVLENPMTAGPIEITLS